MPIEINLAQDTEDRLRLLAAEHGFATTEAFVAKYLEVLAEQSNASQSAPMTSAELTTSLERIDESMAQIDSGEGLTIDQAREALLRPLRGQAG